MTKTKTATRSDEFKSNLLRLLKVNNRKCRQLSKWDKPMSKASEDMFCSLVCNRVEQERIKAKIEEVERIQEDLVENASDTVWFRDHETMHDHLSFRVEELKKQLSE